MVYTNIEVMKITTTKVFNNGNSQAVRIPKEFRFTQEEVCIKKSGSVLMIFEKDSAFANFMNILPVSDDFGDAILDARKNDIPQERELFD